MICLPSTQTLQVVLGSGETAQYTSTWAIKSTGAVAQSNGTLGSTDTNVVTAPSSGDYHLVKQLTIYNDDTTSITATIKLDASGTETILCKMSVPIGSTLFYSPESGFQILQPSTIGASFGAVKSSYTTIAITTFTEVVFNSSQFDTHGWYSASSGRFTPQRAGRYRFSASLNFENISTYANMFIVKNSSTSGSPPNIYMFQSKTVDSVANTTGSVIMSMNGTDYVSIWVNNGDESTIAASDKQNTFFGEWVGD